MHLYWSQFRNIICWAIFLTTAAECRTISIEISHDETFAAEELKEQEVIHTFDAHAEERLHVIKVGVDLSEDLKMPPDTISSESMTSSHEITTSEPINKKYNHYSVVKQEMAILDNHGQNPESDTRDHQNKSKLFFILAGRNLTASSTISNIDPTKVRTNLSAPSSTSKTEPTKVGRNLTAQATSSKIDPTKVGRNLTAPATSSKIDPTKSGRNLTAPATSSKMDPTKAGRNLTAPATSSKIDPRKFGRNATTSKINPTNTEKNLTTVAKSTTLKTDPFKNVLAKLRRRHKRQVGLDLNEIANEGWAYEHTTPADNSSTGAEEDSFQVITEADRDNARNAQIKKILIFTGSTLLTVLMFTGITFCFLRDPKSCIVAFGTGCPCLLVVFPCVMKCLDKYLNPSKMVQESLNRYMPGVIIHEDGTIEKYDVTPEEVECIMDIIDEVTG